MVEKLLEKGAKVPNNSGMPMIPERAIMHMALARSSKEDEYRLIKLLLKHGGNPSECLMTPSNRFLEAPVPPPPLRYLLHAAGNDQELIDILKSFGARIY